MSLLPGREEALVELGRWLRQSGYHFVTITPESHRRVNARAGNRTARSLRDVFGWSRPFEEGSLPSHALELLREAGALCSEGALLKAAVRFSNVDGLLLAHSAYPTLERDSVFLGPDTYRFVALAQSRVTKARRVVDIGAGTGAGVLSLAGRVDAMTLTDISPAALQCCRINAKLAGLEVELVQGNLLEGVKGEVDLILANPPYIVDEGARTYRDGGGELGTGIALNIVDAAVERLAPGGRLLLYSGAPVVDGEDVLRRELEKRRMARGLALDYRELDPDVFGEELERDVYETVDRIAAVSLELTKS